MFPCPKISLSPSGLIIALLREEGKSTGTISGLIPSSSMAPLILPSFIVYLPTVVLLILSPRIFSVRLI